MPFIKANVYESAMFHQSEDSCLLCSQPFSFGYENEVTQHGTHSLHVREGSGLRIFSFPLLPVSNSPLCYIGCFS